MASKDKNKKASRSDRDSSQTPPPGSDTGSQPAVSSTSDFCTTLSEQCSSLWKWFLEHIKGILAVSAFIGLILAIRAFFVGWHNEVVHRLDRVSGEINEIRSGVLDLSHPKNDPYIFHGIIAEFNGPPQDGARTSLGEELSLLSDSAQRLSSTVWYERIPSPQSEGDGDGYLRLHYHLISDTAERVPYVGVYANFSNPPVAYDASRYAGVELTIRAGSAFSRENMDVAIALADSNVVGSGNYAFAEAVIDDGDIGAEEFQTARLLFTEFQTPGWSNEKYEFNPAAVHRFIVKIQGRPGPDFIEDGWIDIDDIRFFSAH